MKRTYRIDGWRKSPVFVIKDEVKEDICHCTRIAAVIFTMSVIAIVIVMWCRHKDNERTLQTQNEMSKEISEIGINETKKLYELPVAGIERVFSRYIKECRKIICTSRDTPRSYQPLYEQNPDMIGWLKIEDTVIDYPVMQTMEDEKTIIWIMISTENLITMVA